MALLRKKGVNSAPAKRWWIPAGGVALAVVLLGAFMSMRKGATTVRAVNVERGLIRSVISTNGKIEPVENFEAHAPMATTVKRILVHEGQRVRQGQLLLELDDTEARSQQARAIAQLKGAQADVQAVQNGGTREEVLTTEADLVKARTERESAQRNLDALKRLYEKGAASSGEVREAENQLLRSDAQLNLLQQRLKDRYSPPEVARVQAQGDQARATLAAAEGLLRQSNIRAPRDAIVYSLPARTGAYVSPGDLLVQEADLSKVSVRAFIDEPDVGRLQQGQKIEVTWDALPGRTWQGTVTGVPASVKLRGTRNVGEVTCEVQNADLKLLPNVNVSVAIITAEREGALILPREAVRQEDGRPYVYLIQNGALKQQEVETALSNLTQVEVTRGIPEHAQVALSSLDGKPLRAGMPVTPVR